MKSKHQQKPLLFIVPGVLMLLAGFGLMLSCSIGERLGSEQALMLPLGFATAAVGAIVLTRHLLGTFFLFIYALVVLVIGVRHHGVANPTLIPCIALILLCLPQAKYART
jgi:hypothetical protein